MKILAVSHSCVVDVNQQLFVAMRALGPRAPEIVLILPGRWKSEYNGDGRTFAPRLLPAVDFPVFPLPVVAPGHVSLHAYTRLPSYQTIRRFAPDVVYASQEPWSLSGWQALRLARRFNVPFVFHTNQNLVKRLPAPFAQIEQVVYRHAALALTYSEEARQALVRKGFDPAKPSRVVPYGTDLSRFAPAPPPAGLRAALGLDADCLVAGYLGRFTEAKGLDLLVNAVARLRAASQAKGGFSIKTLLVGSGPGEDALRCQVAARGLNEHVVFAGSVPHDRAADYLRCMDVLVLPSRTTPAWKEQFGRVLIEALACGVPVIGSSSGEIPRLIAQTGGGLIFAEGDANDLAAKLDALLVASSSEQRVRLGEMGRRAVQARYTFEAVARQTVDALQVALDVGRRAAAGAPRAAA